MKIRIFLIITLVSLLLTFAVAPLRMYSYDIFNDTVLYLGTLIRGLIFWGLTVYFITKYKGIVKPYKIVLLVLFIDLLPDIIVRVFMGHFFSALSSFPDSLLQIAVVLLGWWYAQTNKIGKVVLLLLNIFVCVGVSTYGFVLWNELDMIKNRTSDRLEIIKILKQQDSPVLNDSIINNFQDKTLIVYIGGERDERNMSGISFMKKVYEEFEGKKDIALLSLICLDKTESQVRKTLPTEKNKFPVFYIEMDKSQIDKSDLYQLYVVDRNAKIRTKEDINLPINEAKKKECHKLKLLRELIEWLNKD